MSPTLASDSDGVRAGVGVIRDDETVLLMIRPSAWFIVSTSVRVLPAAVAAGVLLMLASLDPSIPWDFRGALFASTAIVLARAAWQTVDWCVRLYILTDRRIVVRRGVIPEVSECLLTEVAGIGQPRRWSERIGRTGSLAILRGPSRTVRRARRARNSSTSRNSSRCAPRRPGAARRCSPAARPREPREGRRLQHVSLQARGGGVGECEPHRR